MNSLSKKIITLSCLTIIPLVVIILRSFILTRKGWSVHEIQFQTIFWIVRAGIAPFLILFFIRVWTEINRIYLLAVRHATGFIVYLLLHWSISFGLSKLFLPDFDPRNLNLFNIIKDASFLQNFLAYSISGFVFYLWVYFERERVANKRAVVLEKKLTDSNVEHLNRAINLKTESPSTKETIDRLTIKTGSKVTIVLVQNITYLEANGPYVKINAGGKVHLMNIPLYELQILLPASFLRVHRSYIVNTGFIKHVKSLGNGDYILILQNDAEIRASRTYRENLRALLGKL